jgi:hypothetical protein
VPLAHCAQFQRREIGGGIETKWNLAHEEESEKEKEIGDRIVDKTNSIYKLKIFYEWRSPYILV